MAARGCILAAVIAAACCILPVSRPGASVPWGAAALLAALCLVCEAVGRRFDPGSVQAGAGSFLPLLPAAAFLLPPPAAALVAAVADRKSVV